MFMTLYFLPPIQTVLTPSGQLIQHSDPRPPKNYLLSSLSSQIYQVLLTPHLHHLKYINSDQATISSCQEYNGFPRKPFCFLLSLQFFQIIASIIIFIPHSLFHYILAKLSLIQYLHTINYTHFFCLWVFPCFFPASGSSLKCHL